MIDRLRRAADQDFRPRSVHPSISYGLRQRLRQKPPNIGPLPNSGSCQLCFSRGIFLAQLANPVRANHNVGMAKKQRNKEASTDPDVASQPPSFASIYPGTPPNDNVADDYAVSPVIADCVRRLEAEVGMPVWLLVQSNRLDDADAPYHSIDRYVVGEFFASRLSILRKGEPIALVVYSPGGSARYAYELAMLLRRHCGGFLAVVPRYAKSAATILTLGANEILMNVHAELGPVDAQIYDPERQEQLCPALNEAETLDELGAFAVHVFHEMMPLLSKGSDLTTSSLMPIASEFATRLVAPLFDKIDVVRYTQVSRALAASLAVCPRMSRAG